MGLFKLVYIAIGLCNCNENNGLLLKSFEYFHIVLWRFGFEVASLHILHPKKLNQLVVKIRL